MLAIIFGPLDPFFAEVSFALQRNQLAGVLFQTVGVIAPVFAAIPRVCCRTDSTKRSQTDE
jgi:hypothetical protein